MKKMWLKKTFSIALAAGMALSLAACGGSSSDGKGNTGKKESESSASEEATHYFRADYLGDLPDSFRKSSGIAKFQGDKLYYATYNDDYSQETIYSLDVLTGENKEYFTTESGSADIFAETITLYQFCVDNSGNIFAFLGSRQIDKNTLDMDKYDNATKEDFVNYVYTNWGYDTYEAAEQYVDENAGDYNPNGYTYGELLMQYESTDDNYVSNYYLVKYDATGAQLYKNTIETDSTNSYCNAIGTDDKGNVYIALDDYSDDSSSSYVLAVDTEGNTLGKVDLESNYVSSLLTTADGKCAFLSWAADGNGYELIPIDADSLSLGDGQKIGSGTVNNCVALDDHTYLYSGDDGLYTYDTQTQSKEKYLKWLDCNLSSSNTGAFNMLSDGTLAVYIQSWTSSGSSSDLAVLTEISEEEAKSITQINVATFYTDYNMESAAIEFNKKHTDYHINLNAYYDWSSDVEYQDALDSFMTAIVSDTSIDVVCFNDYSQMLNFAAKGLLIDLNSVLANDAELSPDKIITNIVNACTYDGKLVALPSSFSVNTLVGKVSDVGTEPGWTFADMKKLYESKEAGTQLLSYTSRDAAFSTFISLGYSEFIDLENKTCNFNNDDFVNVLELVNLFPESVTYDEDNDETELMNQGKILLYQTSLPDFAQMQMLSNVFGDELTYIGYPTSSGNGSMMSLNSLTGITKYCEHTDMAWEFLRELYLPSDDSYYGSNYYSGSILKSEFDKFFADATNAENYKNLNWSWGNFETEIHAPSQEEVDTVKDIILNSTAVNGAVSTGVLNIIKEEASAYFSGQKTAKDVAAIIQSRIEIYLSETM